MTSALDLKFAYLAREIQRLKSLGHECLLWLHVAVCAARELVYITTDLTCWGNLQAFLGSECCLPLPGHNLLAQGPEHNGTCPLLCMAFVVGGWVCRGPGAVAGSEKQWVLVPWSGLAWALWGDTQSMGFQAGGGVVQVGTGPLGTAPVTEQGQCGPSRACESPSRLALPCPWPLLGTQSCCQGAACFEWSLGPCSVHRSLGDPCCSQPVSEMRKLRHRGK